MERYIMVVDLKTILLKYQFSPKLIYRVNAIPIKILAGFYLQKWQADFTLWIEMQKT